MRLGEKLRRVRLERKLTQRELAGADFTAPFISQVEKGLTVPSLKALIILANRLGCAPGYFLESKAERDRNRIDALLNWSRGCLVLGDGETALARAGEALRAAQELGDAMRQAQALHGLALAHAAAAGTEPAREHFIAAGRIFAELEDDVGQAAVNFQLGLLQHQAGDLKGAVLAYQQALPALERVDAAPLAARVQANLGAALLALGETEPGIALIREAAARAGEFADLASLGQARLRRTLDHWEQGEVEQALAESRRAGELLEALDLARTAALVEGNMGVVAAEQGRWQDAGRHHARSLELNRQVGERRGEAHALTGLARYHQQQGDGGQALELGRRALALAAELDSPALQARAHFVLGSICRQDGAPAEALSHLTASVQGYEALGWPNELADSYYELGELLLAEGRKEEALEHFQRSASLLRPGGAGRPPEARPTGPGTLNLVP